MKPLRASIAVSAIAALIGVLPGPAIAGHTQALNAAQPATKALTIQGFAFHAKRVIVRVGTRVTWTNHDTDLHTVKDVSGGWSSKALDTKGTYSHVFLKPGTYRYFCTIHPVMRGTVVVK